MQTFNYHGHTKRCGHASGEDEEYVIEAIQNGYKRIGFSDHAPYKNGYHPTERMHDYELPQYIESVKHLQKKYADQIEIRIGLEIEFYEKQLDELQSYKEMMDYLILGQHSPALHARDFYRDISDDEVLLYASLIEKACDMGLPDIIAHPDLFMFGRTKWNEACEEASHIICSSAQKHHIALEVNLNGLKNGLQQLGEEYRYTYPYRKFWLIAQNYKVDVVYGLDAHVPQKYGDRECFDIVNNEILYDIPLHFLTDLVFHKK